MTHCEWCRECQRLVDVAVEEVVPPALQAIGTMAGVGVGASQAASKDDNVLTGLLRTTLWAAGGYLTTRVVAPKVKQLVCRDCGHCVSHAA